MFRPTLDSYISARAEWLSTVFPKFSSKPRANKPADVVPPEHRSLLLGKFSLAIGPHIFVDTALYEVHYSASTALATSSTPNTSWHSSTPYTPSQYPLHSHPSSAVPLPSQPSSNSHQVRATTPLVSSIAPELARPSTLASLLDDAAASNPTLSNLIRQALSGQASAQQLETLHVLIKSLAASPSTITPPPVTTPTTSTGRPPYIPPAYGAPAYQQSNQGHGYTTVPSYAQPTPQPQPQPQLQLQAQRSYDLVLEFKEKPSDRWLFPRGPTACERTPSTGPIEQILISTTLPFPKASFPPSALDASFTKKLEAPRQVVTFRLSGGTPSLWNSLVKWCGGTDEMEKNKATLKSIVIPALHFFRSSCHLINRYFCQKSPKRVFLQQRLPDGDLLTQLREVRNWFSWNYA